MERLFPVGRRLTGLVRPVLSRVTSVPVAGDAVFDATRRFYERLDGVRELLTDGERSSVRLVVNPERMVIAEARRTYTYLSLFGYHVDAVIANRLLPDAITDPWFESWKEAHAEHLTTIEDGFAPLPVLRAELAEHELVGVERLRAFADTLYGDAEPRRCCTRAQPLKVERRGTRSVLSIQLPFTDATTSSSAATTASCSCASGPTGVPSCCPTRSSDARSPAPVWWTAGSRSLSRHGEHG